MYRPFYNLAEKPFQLSTDPRFLWLGEKHKEALATLKYGVFDQKGFLLVSGDVGTGKTTLINALLENIEHDSLVANITDPSLDLIEFFNFIAFAFNFPKKFDSKIDFIVYFRQFLKNAYSKNRHVLLIIDEVHSLSKEFLEQIRLLSNIELPPGKLFSIFFVGQNEILQTLALPECRALRQRISLVYQLEPLSENETMAYIKHRLQVAGTGKNIFTQKAVQEIHLFSKGYPRLINTICDHALLIGYAQNLKKITPDVIIECAQQFAPINDPQNVNHFTSHNSHQIIYRPSSAPVPILEYAADVTKVFIVKQLQNIKYSWMRFLSLATRMRKKVCLLMSDVSLPALLRKKICVWTSAAGLALMVLVITSLYQKVSATKNIPSGSAATDLTTASLSIGNAERYVTVDQFPMRIDEAVSDHRKMLPVPPKTEISKHDILAQAKTALFNKNFSQAIALFEQGIAQNPTYASAINIYYSKALQGQAHIVFKDDSDIAEKLLSRAVESDPQNAAAHFDLGRLYTELKNYPKAITAYQKAATLNHRPSDTFYNLGFIYASTEDFESAEKMFLHVVDLKPPYLDKVLFNLAVVQHKQGKKHQCMENLEKARIKNPKNKRVKLYLNQLKKDKEMS